MTPYILRYFVLVHAVSVGIASAESPFVELLVDGDLNHWSSAKNKKGWSIEAGVLTRSHDGAGSLMTKQNFRDFELVFEWNISMGGNSGVIYRSQKGRGLEYQILDDDRHRAGKRYAGTSASLYALVAAPADKPYKPAGEWNSGRIVAIGHHVEHWLNGKKVLQADLSGEDWRRRYQQSKYAEYRLDDFGLVASPIILQDHGAPVSFRNLRIRDLGGTELDETGGQN